MNKTIAASAAFLLLAACGQDNSTSEEASTASAEPELHSGVILDNLDLDVRPGNDFNKFVNGTWMATAELPADRSSDGA